MSQRRINPLTLNVTHVKETPYSKDEWHVVECLETGMVFLENPPDYVSFEETFAWEKQFEIEKARRQNAEPIRSKVSQFLKYLRTKLHSRESIEREAERLILGQKRKDCLVVLDVGCGIGIKLQRICAFMQNTHDIKLQPIGIEISIQQAEQANYELSLVDGYCIQKTAIEGLQSTQDETFDLLILHSFLEHEINPLPLLEACRDKMVDSGQILIKVPNYDCINRKIRQEKWCGFRYPDHVNYFTPDTLKRIIEAAGLKCSELTAQPFNDNMWAVAEKL